MQEKGLSADEVEGGGARRGAGHRVCKPWRLGQPQPEQPAIGLVGTRNVAALGEIWMGAAQGCRSAVMVTLGTGVGGGVIVNGKVIDGAHGAGGEIGHMTTHRRLAAAGPAPPALCAA